MPRQNQIIIDVESRIYACLGCNARHFPSEHSLFQHCRTSNFHQDEWCDRCEWLFVDSGALAQHIEASHNHWVCQFCDEDLDARDDLDLHLIQHHRYCYDCDVQVKNYHQHRVSSHLRCPQCHHEFDNDNNLNMHSQVHLPRKIDCYGCDRQFAKHSAVLIHLESGNCDCNVTRDFIERLAFECYQSRHFTNDWSDDFRFRCPECDQNFQHVSSLLQHVESPACSAGYKGSILKLQHYISICVTSLNGDIGSDTS